MMDECLFKERNGPDSLSLSLVSTDPEGLPAHQEAGSHQTPNVGYLELGPPTLQDRETNICCLSPSPVYSIVAA